METYEINAGALAGYDCWLAATVLIMEVSLGCSDFVNANAVPGFHLPCQVLRFMVVSLAHRVSPGDPRSYPFGKPLMMSGYNPYA